MEFEVRLLDEPSPPTIMKLQTKFFLKNSFIEFKKDVKMLKQLKCETFTISVKDGTLTYVGKSDAFSVTKHFDILEQVALVQGEDGSSAEVCGDVKEDFLLNSLYLMFCVPEPSTSKFCITDCNAIKVVNVYTQVTADEDAKEYLRLVMYLSPVIGDHDLDFLDQLCNSTT